MAQNDGLFKSRVWENSNVEVNGTGSNAPKGSADAITLIGEWANLYSIFAVDFWYVFWMHVLAARRCHFLFGREIDPQLETLQQVVLLLGHCGVNNSPACGHPLNTVWAKITFIAFMAFVSHEAR